jgi:DNA polymerase
MLKNAISLDFETFSSTNLKALGAYKYAEGRDTEVLILAVQQHGSDEVLSWDVRSKPNAAIALLRRAIEEKWEIHAFNVQFEWVILKYVCPRQFGFPVPDIGTMRCTAAMCRSAGLPPSLAKAATFLKLPILKDSIGHPLIRTFSVPNKKMGRKHWDTEGTFTLAGERVTYEQAFQKFVDYCVQDVRTEVAVANKMSAYELKGFPLEWFQLDMRMNDRGVPVDRVALQAAYEMFREKEQHLTDQFRAITNLGPSQNAKCLEWFRERGYLAPKLDKKHREEQVKRGNLTDEALEALRLKSLLAYAAVKKIPSMISRAMADGHIRGSFLWCGAQKTWRWTSQTPQWQNMKKPPKWLRPGIEGTYQTLKNQELCMDNFEFLYGPAYEVVASLARYFVRFPDANILDLDFSAVEAKILPFAICADRIMEKIRTGGDIYIGTAASLSQALKEKHTVGFDIDRETAKTIVLATQFQGGWHAVYTATGEKWNRAWCETAVQIVRKENPEFPVAWRAFQDSFVAAFHTPHKWIEATPYAAFAYVTKGPFPRMLMRLPSGRKITYPYPECNPITMVKVATKGADGKVIKREWVRESGHFEDEDSLAAVMKMGDPFFYPKSYIEASFPTHELSFYGHIKGVNYGRVPTYGGDLLQSLTQGIGADLLAHGAINADKAGFLPFFLVHDQALTPDDGRKEEFEKVMCSIPEWFQGFPLEATADSVRSYCKS